jgi:hypothetical protein
MTEDGQRVNAIKIQAPSVCARMNPRGKVWVWVVVVLVVLPIIGIILFHLTTGSAINKRMAELRAQRQPVTLKELNESYTLPVGVENAAYFYLDAIDRLAKWSNEDKNRLPVVGHASLPSRAEPISDANQVLAQQYLSDNKDALTILHEAAVLTHARYPLDFTQGQNMSIPWLSSVRDCARLLKLEALICVENGDPNRAVESVQACLALTGSLKAPLLIEHLVRIAVLGLSYQTLERILSRCALTDEQLGGLIQILDTVESTAGLKNAFIGERSMGLSFFRQPLRAAGSMSSSGNHVPTFVLAPLRALGILKWDQLAYLDIMQDYIKAFDMPIQQRRQAAQRTSEDVDAGRRGGILTRLIVPALGRVMELDVRAQAGLLACRTGLQVERFRLATGQLPESLDQLVPLYLPAVPSDPFDGQPLRYKTLAKGFVVYSIGVDLSDDGGAEQVKSRRRSGQKPLPYDRTFIVER